MCGLRLGELGSRDLGSVWENHRESSCFSSPSASCCGVMRRQGGGRAAALRLGGLIGLPTLTSDPRLVALTKLSSLDLSVPSFRKGYQNSSCCVSTFPEFLGG